MTTYLAGVVERTVVQVIAPHERHILRSQVEFEVLEEGVGVLRGERHEDAEATREGRVDKTLRTAGDQRRLLQTGHYLAHVEVAQHLDVKR